MPVVLEKTHSQLPASPQHYKINIEYAEDALLMQRVSSTSPITLELISNNEQPAPTVGQLLALYFRLIDELCYRTCFNNISEEFSPPTAWFGEHKFHTLSFMNNYTVVFDKIYRLCVDNTLLNKLRQLYEDKVIFQQDLTEEHIHGLTVKITSLEQAIIYLDGMSSRVFAANLSYILSHYHKQDVERVFSKLDLEKGDKTELEKRIIALVDNKILEQGEELAHERYHEQGIYAENEKYLLLHTLNYLKYGGVFSVTLQHLGLSVLCTHLLGIDSINPSVHDIGLLTYNSFAFEDEAMSKSLIDSSIMAHRQHYPNKVLSTLY